MEKLDIHTIINYLEKNLHGLQAVYLFGSFASGYANKESDVDIAILQQDKLPFEKRLKTTTGLSILLNRDVDLIQLRYVDTVFQEEILKTAKRIATYDRITCELYEDYVFCSAMDFREFRKPHLEEIVIRGSVYG